MSERHYRSRRENSRAWYNDEEHVTVWSELLSLLGLFGLVGVFILCFLASSHP